MSTAYISHQDCIKHQMIEHHPESPQRTRIVEEALKISHVYDYMRHYDAPMADIQDLKRAHDPDHVEHLFNISPTGSRLVHVDPDTWMNEWTLEAAQRAAGAGVHAVDLIMSGEAKTAFCNVRPPGHHAEYEKAMGFCFFNNIAVAALYAVTKYQLERVAIVDFDVHHGNGSEDICWNNEQVLFCSTYQHPFYPECAKPSIPGQLINAPLSAGADGAEFADAVEKHWLPALREYKPQMIFISAGFDAHREDDMGGLNLVEADYTWVTQQLKSVAEETAEGRMVSMLEGGYNLSSLARSVVAHVRALMSV